MRNRQAPTDRPVEPAGRLLAEQTIERSEERQRFAVDERQDVIQLRVCDRNLEHAQMIEDLIRQGLYLTIHRPDL